MSATVEELKAWLNDIDQDCEIAIDDGGLTLIGVKPDKTIATYYELAGELLKIELLDHIIIGAAPAFCSLRQLGYFAI